MNRSSFSFLFFILAFTVQAQITNPDELIQKAFAALQAKDEKAYLSLCPNSAQLERIIKRMDENFIAEIRLEREIQQRQNKGRVYSSTKSPDEVDSFIRSSLQHYSFHERIQGIQKMLIEGFRFMIEKGEKRGINWQAATLISYSLDSSKLRQQKSRPFFEGSGYPSAQGIVHFEAGDSAYQMSFNDILFLPEEKDWYVAYLEKLVREGEPLENDHEGEEVREVVVQNMAFDESPPPPPPKKKRSISAKKKRPPKP